MIDYDELKSTLNNSLKNVKQVWIVTHIRPDFDTIGSAFALDSYCKKIRCHTSYNN